MKVNILIGDKNKPLNGYTNINQTASPNDTEQIPCELNALDGIISHNECEEVLALQVLDHFPLQMRQPTLVHWLCKLKHGGKITISATDPYEMARLIHVGEIENPVQFNELVYGQIKNVWDIKKSVLPLQDTIGMIMQTGQFNIESVKYEGPYYYIVARRK